jgi:hypothetical protein
VNVVVFAIELYQLSFKVVTDLFEDASQVAPYLIGEDAAPVLGYEDQMYVHLEYTVPTVANAALFIHIPMIQWKPCSGYRLTNTN